MDDDPPDNPTTPEIPATPHKAYCAGWDAARRGDDLASVVYDAAMAWPLDDIRDWCELVASASLGYWTEGSR